MILTLPLTAGKRYIRRDGSITPPLKGGPIWLEDLETKLIFEPNHPFVFDPSGSNPSDKDLVADYTEHRTRDGRSVRILATDLKHPRYAIAAAVMESTGNEFPYAFTAEGYYYVKNGIEPCIERAKAYAPYADMIWMETGTPDLEYAKKFAEAVKAEFPDQMLAYNCSPSFNWKKNLDDDTIAKFQRELGAMGYTFQFITLAGFHALNHSMFDLAKGYNERQMSAYVELQEREFADEARGYTATKHQREVGTGYFDAVSTAINPDSSTVALAGSTESGQFH